MTEAPFDVYDPELYEQGVPHDVFARLRAEAPVYHHDDPQQPDGYWCLTRHEDVVFVSRHPELFSSHERTAMLMESPEEAVAQQQLIMLNMDDPEHGRLRSLVNRGFIPRMIARLEERTKAICSDLVDKAIEQGEGDFVTLCAAELPLIMIAELMGVPHEDRHKLFEWSNRMIGFDDPEFHTSPEAAQVAAMEIIKYAQELGEAKRNAPVDDIVSKLVSKDDQGRELSDLEFDMFFILLAVAGNETTRNAISGGMLALIENPEQWERLRADPEGLIVSAAEEIVRWVTPVIEFRRTAMTDVEVGGQQIKKGDKVVVYYASANRDESVFPDAHVFDIGRDPNPHIGYGGGGPHFCLGAHLARLELQWLFRTLAERCERVELTAPARRLRSNFINGIKEMPVRFIPATGGGARG
jgi:cholest-4-en-3-one 26-monooxygenase